MMTLLLLESHVLLLLYGFNSEQSTQIIQRMFFVKSCYRIDTNCRQTDQDDKDDLDDLMNASSQMIYLIYIRFYF